VLTAAAEPAAARRISSANGGGGAAMVEKTFDKGDKVAWETSQGETRGRVVRKQTRPTTIKGHKVAASKDNPEYIVESDRTGARAAHKPGALKRR
jgi:hypothetical protein